MTESKQAVLKAIKETTDQWRVSDEKRDAGLPTQFADVTRYDNLSYGPAGTENLLDVYTPKEITQKVPVIIDIHGGGNVYGSKELYQHYCLGWARVGFGVVNFNYRLAPKTPFPGALKDTALVGQWISEHCEKYHLDVDNVFVIGDSAGGTLAEQYLTAYSNEAYRTALGLVSSEKLKIRGGCLNSGFYFIERSGAIPENSLMSAYYTPEVMHRYDQQLHTEKFITTKFPPVFVMTANHDFLHDEGVRFDQFLIDKGVPHEFKVYGDEKEPREHVFQLNQRDAIAANANHAQAEFLRTLMK
ncbi:alpha/beta hydrolase [Pediococcus ethanolidurans]|uniref:alpha/beta hydrolase n=1 Tax=Pediococcus ethanolidurans TaxID=319653 RepID=UPI0021AAD291|nr:alpha/beta hydrolase [Pediococcus ethanolidurans]MCT4398982.1 alpha/beta hydrolase [Pediococcus ethanolidurans]MCV3321309.1 alpha/beta hydrolase [Pediococcus ethanolidurans]MCV3323703.1 alpha/beta hydrolase [Pediococcus ethanolidurans]